MKVVRLVEELNSRLRYITLNMNNAIPFIPTGDYYAGNRSTYKTHGVVKGS